MKFKKGAKVIITEDHDGAKIAGKTGVVVRPDSDSYGERDWIIVSIDGWTDEGWDETNPLKDGPHWSVPASILQKKPKEKKSDAKQTYKGNGKHEWEAVTVNTARLRVPGGWLYRYHGGFGGEVNTVVFVPMPEVVKHVI